ncbi:MAG: hypothetical protein ACK5PQ_01955 [Alphaproteobacteria bacterium]
MRSPNPSSFRNFSALKKRSVRRRRIIPVLLVLVLIGGAGGAFFLFHPFGEGGLLGPGKKINSPVQSPLSSKVDTKEYQEEAYKDFVGNEDPVLEQISDEEAQESSSPHPSDPLLLQIFKAQEQQKSLSFSSVDAWKKSRQKAVRVPRGKDQIVLLVEGSDTLPNKEWKILDGLGIPLTIILPQSLPNRTHLTQKYWKKGYEIVGKKNNKNSFFPDVSRVVGFIETEPETGPYGLTVLEKKGLIGGKPHHVSFFSPSRKQTIKRGNLIMWVSAKKGQLAPLKDWVRQQKKTAVFVPLSQLYQDLSEVKSQQKIITVKNLQDWRARTL